MGWINHSITALFPSYVKYHYVKANIQIAQNVEPRSSPLVYEYEKKLSQKSYYLGFVLYTQIGSYL